jgi:rhamnulokinase
MGINKNHFLAFDLGASSGRAILGTLHEGKLSLTEIHRFKNQMACIQGSYFWNIFSLFEELKKGLARCISEFNIKPLSIGIDTWGVDYALVTEDGRLAGLPFAYRDHRTDNAMERFFSLIPQKDTYFLTGIQFMQFNTLFQLFSSVKQNDPFLQIADKLLFTPDVLNYFFTGIKKNEYTIASTSQLLMPGRQEWEQKLFEVSGIPQKLQAEIILPGTILGNVLPEVDEQTGCGIIPCVAVASHDTASAVVSVPAEGENWAYLSSGTWSLLGIETPAPVISEKSLQMNFTNEGGAEQKIRFLKNIMGMWLIQECKRIWDRDKETDWNEIVHLCHEAEPFKYIINPDSQQFLNPGNMPEAIRDFCIKTGQSEPVTRGEIARCIYDSLALKYKYTLLQIEEVSGKKIDRLHIIGGGASNEMLNQLTADITGKQVISGPAEATAIGNIMMQAKALGITGSLSVIREIVRNSFEVKIYNPSPVLNMNKAYERFLKLV